MKVSMRAVLATALVALLAPAAAGAKRAEIDGPALLAGKGFFGGELQGSADAERPVKIVGRGGYVGFLDLGGDLKVRCAGQGRVHEKKTEQGTVYLCAGRAGSATASGSHFRFRGFAVRYRVQVPEGVSGTFHGRFVVCTKSADGEAACGDESAPEGEPGTGTPPNRGEPAKDPKQPKEPFPTLAETAKLLNG